MIKVKLTLHEIKLFLEEIIGTSKRKALLLLKELPATYSYHFDEVREEHLEKHVKRVNKLIKELVDKYGTENPENPKGDKLAPVRVIKRSELTEDDIKYLEDRFEKKLTELKEDDIKPKKPDYAGLAADEDVLNPQFARFEDEYLEVTKEEKSFEIFPFRVNDISSFEGGHYPMFKKVLKQIQTELAKSE